MGLSIEIRYLIIATLGWGVAILFVARAIWLRIQLEARSINARLSGKWLVTVLDMEDEVLYWQSEAEAAMAHNVRQAKTIFYLDNVVEQLGLDVEGLRVECAGHLDVIESMSAQLEVGARVRAELAALRAGAPIAGDAEMWGRLGDVGEAMADCFLLNDLVRLCLIEFGIRSDDIGGQRLIDKCMWVIGDFHRQGNLDELLRVLVEARPHVDWEGMIGGSVNGGR